MEENPFTSGCFTETWLRHFAPARPVRSPQWISPLHFTRHRFLPVFENLGRTLTKGLVYSTHPREKEDSDVYIVYDVLPNREIPKDFLSEGLHRFRVPQYPGYLINLEGFISLEDFLQKQFSKSSRYKLKKYRKRLESSFQIRYKMFRGRTERATYDEIFRHFYRLLERRFEDKRISNNNLQAREWTFYQDVAFPMLQDGSAGLFVVYAHDEPIAITLNYFGDSVVFDAITVFDIDYAKFHPGSVSIMGLIDWCLANGMETLDFSKGEFEYKKHWATQEYRFYYDIFYNPRSLWSRIRAQVARDYFDMKQRLRDKRLNETLHRWTYRLKARKTSDQKPAGFDLLLVAEHVIPDKERRVEPGSALYSQLRTGVFEFLYLNNEALADVDIHILDGAAGEYLLSGKQSQARLIITPS
ncbi:GNAT family N-acetyltransferase [Robiginitalea sp. SC105]|uniref:GNAT family N-acetyltransferase n=1 Tax=Robiginitalea sp. SC105 TaxID=2762332 RepID=UPI00163B3C11|nr:GNAT family N-acetyltransferase [Robiginitalea sp. SC105]MBC2840321.1 GNAT family N-acetyltransferase [Robiginitalea sp. SC105]